MQHSAASEDISFKSIPFQTFSFPILRYPYESETGEVRNVQEIQKEKRFNVDENLNNDTETTDKEIKLIKSSQVEDKYAVSNNIKLLNLMFTTDANVNVNQQVVKSTEQNLEKDRKRIEMEGKTTELQFRKHKAETELAEMKLAKKLRKN